MADIEKAKATQLANIEKKTGKSLKQLAAAIKASRKSQARRNPLPGWSTPTGSATATPTRWSTTC